MDSLPIQTTMTRPQLAPDPIDASTKNARAVEHVLSESKRDPDFPWASDGRSRRILGMRVDSTNYGEAVDSIAQRAEAGDGAMVCVSTVHMVMEAFDDVNYRKIVNAADLVTPDGMPLVWGLRSLGIATATRVYGPALTGLLCRRAEALDIPIGFYGGDQQVLDELVQRLSARFSKLRIVFAMSPPFRELSAEEDDSITDAIEASGAKILFVGLGCPKQERWMAQHRGCLPCTLVGVGAAFDFLAGAKRQAPLWMQRSGLEWLFRLASEPRRLWRRYLIGNPRFLTHFTVQLLREFVSQPARIRD